MFAVSEPHGVSETTPSGVVVRYQPHPRTYWVNGMEVPSVTTVLDILAKPALVWWGMKIGVQGVCTLKRLGVDLPWDDPEGIVSLLTAHKLTVNHVKGKAAERGLSVHDALERWCRTKDIPDPADYPEEEAGYVKALALFLVEKEPEPLKFEVMVGSPRFGYAGRYDLFCEIGQLRHLIDLKTSARVYPNHGLQLAAYWQAGLECGYSSAERRVVLRVGKDGKYEFSVRSETFEQFLAVLRAWEALR